MMKSPRRIRTYTPLAAACALMSCTPAWAIVNSSTGTSIADLIGAGTFYNQGYTGTRAVAINVEAGYGWASHESLTHVSQFFDARPAFVAGGFASEALALGSVDFHATWMAHALGGRGATTTQRGIAYGATLWEGAIATSFVSGTTSFNWGRSIAFSYPYSQSLITGRSGRTADVVNSSWGYADGTGSDIFTVALDGITRASARTTVFAAGNNGGNTSLFWGSPGGYNAIIVGALAASGNNYNSVASFSSRGPVPYSDPLGNFVPNARARVDIVAPGENITLARYGGATGGNTGGGDPTGGAINQYQGGVFGTSEASAIVAGGATLLNDVAYDRYAGNARSHDGEVIKAVLLNSARKISGWSNAQAVGGDGVLRTTQALDYVSGAGALDLDTAFVQFTAGTNDLAGNGGGSINLLGWDYGVLAQNGSSNYSFTQMLHAGAKLNATLNWYVGRTWLGATLDGNINGSDDYFTNLALQVWRLDAPGGAALVAESDAAYLNTEHLSFLLASDGLYQLRVAWNGERYDFGGNASQSFGLAWLAADVPEPTVVLMLLAGVGVVVLRVRARGAARYSSLD